MVSFFFQIVILQSYILFCSSYIPTCDFKAPNTDDAEEKDNEIERILDGQVIEEKPENKTGWDIGGDVSKSTTDGIETITFPKVVKV